MDFDVVNVNEIRGKSKAGTGLLFAVLMLANLYFSGPAWALSPSDGVLNDGDSPRVFVSTDIGGSDEDDDQSMVHFFLYADVLNVEGMISSPPHGGRRSDVVEVIEAYEADYDQLKTHGAYFVRQKDGCIKMGDTPSVLYMLTGTPADPADDSWGGSYVRPSPDNRPTYWTDNPDPSLNVNDYPGAKTVSKWREAYLRHWQQRMNRARQTAASPK